MPLKGFLLLAALSVGTVTLSFAQEYPFIHYTPKDGLINSRVRNVFQDNKGRLFFMTANGLSVYDGARFNNYSPDDGLANPLVNDMLEISADSFLVVTNTTSINAWTGGKIKSIPIEGFCPVVNKLIRAKNGIIYSATDQGIYSLLGNRFEKISLKNKTEKNRDLPFDDIQESGDRMLVKVIPEMTKTYGLYLLNKEKKELMPLIEGPIISFIQLTDHNLLVCATGNQLTCFDLKAAQDGIVKPSTLPTIYKPLSKIPNSKLFLDRTGNVWCLNLNSILRISHDGSSILFDKTTGLAVNNISGVFIDRENVLWIHTDGSGLLKLATSNVAIVTGLFSNSATGISAIHADLESDTTWLFNRDDTSLYSSTAAGLTKYHLYPKIVAGHILKMKDDLYIFENGKIHIAMRSRTKANTFNAKLLYQFEKGSVANMYGTIEDKGFLYTPGSEVVVIRNDKRIFSMKVPFYTDQLAIDKKGKLWVAPRSGDLFSYTIHPDRPSEFLKLYHNYKAVVPDLNSRSITIDTNNRIWVGTRYDGLYCFEFEDTSLRKMHHFTVREGLTDNFIYYLACDKYNNVWVASQSGLDKVSMENGQYIIEGVTRNTNVFQFIHRIVVSKNNEVWTVGNAGSILRITNNPVPLEYRPQLQVSRIQANDSSFDMPGDGLRLSHFQNNIIFEVAAPSFIDEKQIKFSYLLEGSSNEQWSAASSQATLNFINLPHGNYRLKLRAYFPISSYPPQELTYSFTITPPWWDTWWSKILMAASIVAFIVWIIRFYYRRKLEKQRVLFEKQQAVEQERTRIAMEMHDDLGSGLTTIRYLAGGLSLQAGNASKDKAEKIASSAKSLVDNMNDIIWTMKSDNNTIIEALAYIRKQAAEQLETAGIEYQINFPKELPSIKLSNELKRSLLLISKEAIHNIVKHSAATNVCLSAALEADHIYLKIVDNGKGIDLSDISTFGNGLKNMRKRAEEIRALLEVRNAKGTTIVVRAPI